MKEVLIKETAADTNYVSDVSTEGAGAGRSRAASSGQAGRGCSGAESLPRFPAFVPGQVGTIEWIRVSPDTYAYDDGVPRECIIIRPMFTCSTAGP